MDMQLVAWLAASLVFASFFMKTIVSLRTLAIVSNIVFIAYALLGVHHGIFDKVLPIFVLHIALLPLNLARLREARRDLFKSGKSADTVSWVSSGTIDMPELENWAQKCPRPR